MNIIDENGGVGAPPPPPPPSAPPAPSAPPPPPSSGSRPPPQPARVDLLSQIQGDYYILSLNIFISYSQYLFI